MFCNLTAIGEDILAIKKDWLKIQVKQEIIKMFKLECLTSYIAILI